MTEESFSARPINKEELSFLVSTGMFGHTRKETRSRLEKLRKSSELEAIYLAKEGERFILCGLASVDPIASKASLWLGSSAAAGSDSDTSCAFLSKVLSFLLYESFFQRGLHRIGIFIGEGDSDIRKALETSCFNEEGVLSDYYYENGHHINGISYAMLESDFNMHSTGLVPFLSGYLAVRSTNQTVFSLSILKEGEKVPSFIEEDCGYKDHISNDGKIIRCSKTDRFYHSESAFPYLINALEQLIEYVQGRRTRFDLSFEYSDATEFQKQVWGAAMQIPFGQTRNYEEIAEQLRPNDKNSELRLLSRAVGTALGKNPILIAVPCHRIIGKDGKLKGFAAGLEIKDYLLSHEMLFVK